MKRSWLRRHQAVVPVALFYAAALAVFLYAGDRAQIGIADNLDLFQAQYQMLKNTGTFFTGQASAPFLHGISRDVLPGERSLEGLLYRLFPSFTAYILVYFVKITIALISFVLLAGELEKRGCLKSGVSGTGRQSAGRDDPDNSTWNLAVLGGLTYGILNLFPSYGIAFASIPFLIWLVLRLEREPSRVKCVPWLVLIFCYPFVSYFSYFGIFLIGYLGIAFIWKTIADSVCGRRVSSAAPDDTGIPVKMVRGRRGFHPDLRLLASVIALSLGSVFFEYRLFRQMLLSHEPSIRDTMVQTSLSGGEILQWILRVLVNGVDLHCESMHRYLVLPVCLGYFVILNAGYLRRHEGKAGFHDLYNLGVLILLFDSVVYGLYYSAGFRGIVESLVPQLKGFQFNRTAFFNPFLWYDLFFLAMVRLAGWIRARQEHAGKIHGHRRGGRTGNVLPAAAGAAPYVLMLAASLVIIFHGNAYNDLLNTAKADVKRMTGRPESDALGYREFYSTDLFERVKEEMGYDGEWSAAYGFHPAVLEYNGIATVDGYLGFYSQEYKEQFRKVIAPALEENEATRAYYDSWGARCYLYSGHNQTVVEAVRNYPHQEDTIDIDTEALQELGCRYIFSRIRITNAEEKRLQLIGSWQDESSPYLVHVYELP